MGGRCTISCTLTPICQALRDTKYAKLVELGGFSTKSHRLPRKVGPPYKSVTKMVTEGHVSISGWAFFLDILTHSKFEVERIFFEAYDARFFTQPPASPAYHVVCWSNANQENGFPSLTLDYHFSSPTSYPDNPMETFTTRYSSF